MLQYDEKKNDVIFSCELFFLYHLGIPVLHPGNSLACAVVTGYLSNYEKQYQQAILQFTLNTLNNYYPYQTLKQKQCYFLTNRIEEPLEQRFIREVTRTERCDTFESGMEKLRNIKKQQNSIRCYLLITTIIRKYLSIKRESGYMPWKIRRQKLFCDIPYLIWWKDWISRRKQIEI